MTRQPLVRRSSASALAVVLALGLGLSFAATAEAQEPSGDPREVVGGLEFPSGIAFLPDGSFVVNERGGVVNLVRDGEINKIAEIPTTTDGETGLLGAAVPPGEDDVVFVFATEPGGATNTVWRVPLGEGQPERVISDLPAALYHNGGGVAFGEDGMLYVSNGEQHDSGRAQDPQVLGGKVYRFTPEGEIPDDNPFPGSPAFSIGLRNPFGLAVDPLTGAPWVTENGPSSWDEINRVLPGANHGWPVLSGPASANEADPSELDDYMDPVLAYEGIIVPTGIAFAASDGEGVEAGDLFFASYGEGAIHHVRLDERRAVAESDEIILEAGEPLVALAWGPDGLYFSTTSAVKMLPLAAAEPSATSSATPQASPIDAGGRGSPSAPDDNPKQLVMIGLALLALAGIGMFVFFLTRRAR